MLLFSKRLILDDVKRMIMIVLLEGSRNITESTQQKEGPMTIKNTLKFFFVLQNLHITFRTLNGVIL